MVVVREQFAPVDRLALSIHVHIGIENSTSLYHGCLDSKLNGVYSNEIACRNFVEQAT